MKNNNCKVIGLYYKLISGCTYTHTHTHTHKFEVSFRLPGGSGGYLDGTSGKEPACQRLRFDPRVRKIPLEEQMAIHCSIQSSLEGYSP